MNQTDLFEGARLKRRALKRVLDNEPEKWKTLYRDIAQRELLRMTPGTLFTAENIRAVAAKQLGEPHHFNVWGAMFNGMLKRWREQELIEDAPERLCASASQAHATAIKAYRRR